jgi:hypothetical protein
MRASIATIAAALCQRDHRHARSQRTSAYAFTRAINNSESACLVRDPLAGC